MTGVASLLFRKVTNPTTVTVCMALRKAVKRGTARGIFGLPLFHLKMCYSQGLYPTPECLPLYWLGLLERRGGGSRAGIQSL